MNQVFQSSYNNNNYNFDTQNMMMNNQNNSNSNSNSFDTKHKFSSLMSAPPDSLFRMAMLEWEAEHQQHQHQHQQAMATTTALARNHSGAFFPLEETNDFRDLSLHEIINMTDDAFALEEVNDNEPLAPIVPPMTMSNNSNNNSNMNFGSQQPHMVTPCPSMSTMTSTPTSMMMMMPAPMPPAVPPSPMMNTASPFPTVVASSNGTPTGPATAALLNPKKRSRDESHDTITTTNEDDQDNAEGGPRFRPYQSGQWHDMFHELCAFKRSHGHCLVPHTFTQNLPLARWVKRQRYQYKLMQEGKASSMTPERIQTLQSIGFVWDSQAAAWSERLGELQRFQVAHGHANVPSNFAPHPQLATWVKCQRRQYKLFRDGKPSNMTKERIQMLETIGFEWELRTGHKKSAAASNTK